MQAEKEYVRKNILAAATPLFYAKGYVKVPMRKIAEASHVGLSNLIIIMIVKRIFFMK